METDEAFRQEMVNIGKESLENTARDGEFFVPKMLAEYDGRMNLLTYMEGAFEGLQQVASYLLSLEQPITGIVLTVDTYHLITGKGDDTEDAHQYAGKLAGMFEAGDTRVSEALNITILTADEFYNIIVPYRRRKQYKGGETIVWREAITDATTIEGRFPELLRQVITQSHGGAN